MRLLGGIAIRLHAPDLPDALVRRYNDIDFVAPPGSSATAARFLREEGYTPHEAFNAFNGRERLLFFDEAHGRQLDVFVGSFRMCHELPVAERLDVEPVTIPLAELLLTKLQIVELNEKDVRDSIAILYGHRVADADDEAINAGVAASLCARDWGLWRTITGNLAAVRDRLDAYGLASTTQHEIAAKLDALLERVESEPKSRRWRLRARVGERSRWYELPEEVGREPETRTEDANGS